MRSVDDRGEIALASGPTARLFGLRLPDEAAERAMTLDALRQRIGETVLVASGPPDRWGRVPARIELGQPQRDWAQELVESGRAVVDAGTADHFCQPELLALEETARERRLGLWATQPAPARGASPWSRGACSASANGAAAPISTSAATMRAISR
ncbi:MAG TPA: thermonuclease family protein [Beijerinckiaceae bacterium]